MDWELWSPYPHHAWLAHWLGVYAPRVFETHECHHVAHHVLLTTRGEADIRWTSRGIETVYHSAVGDIGFFPCDHQAHSFAITSADGFTGYELIIPDQQLRRDRGEKGSRRAPIFPARPGFRDALMEASVLRLSARSAGHQVSEDIGDEVAARQILLRLCELAGAAPPDWRRDRSVFTPAIMRQLVAGIDAHLAVPLPLETIAATVRLSPGHFARKFQQSAGVSLQRFINTRRVAAAFTLLQTGPHSLAGIALELGFSSQSHFTRLFSGLTGSSPSQFRRLHRRMLG